MRAGSPGGRRPGGRRPARAESLRREAPRPCRARCRAPAPQDAARAAPAPSARGARSPRRPAPPAARTRPGRRARHRAACGCGPRAAGGCRARRRWASPGCRWPGCTAGRGPRGCSRPRRGDADDAQGLGQRQRVARVPRRRQVRLPLALAADGRVDHRSRQLHHPEPAAQRHHDGKGGPALRVRRRVGGVVDVLQERRVDAEQQARHGDGHVVAGQDVRELVRHHRLQLLPREPGQRALGHPDDAAAVQVAERERVETHRAHRDALDARRAGGDAHLLDDVGEPLVIPVAGVERPAVHGLAAAGRGRRSGRGPSTRARPRGRRRGPRPRRAG